MSPLIEWDQCRLSEVAIPTSTWNPRRDPRPSIRYIDVSAISRDELRIVSEATYSADDAPSRARKIVKAGDTIFATVRPTLRRIAQIPASLDGEIVSTAFCVLRPDRHAIDADFLYFAIQLESVMEGIAAMQSGASYPAVRDVDVLDQVIPLPPLPEQREIAAVLNTIRTALLHQAQCEVNATALKRAAMRTLFTCGLRGEAQKETEIGPVSESWQRLPISVLGKIVTGNTPPTKDPANYTEGEVPFISPGDIEHGIKIEKTEKFITDQGLKYSRPITRETTCFVCIGSTIGKVGYTIFPICATNQQINSVLPNDRFDPLFTFYLLAFWADHVRKHASRSPVPILSKGAFEQIEVVATTNIDEQREISAVLDAIDCKINLHRRKRAVLDDLFEVLLHKMMTGEIRVSDLDLPTITTEGAECSNK